MSCFGPNIWFLLYLFQRTILLRQASFFGLFIVWTYVSILGSNSFSVVRVLVMPVIKIILGINDIGGFTYIQFLFFFSPKNMYYASCFFYKSSENCDDTWFFYCFAIACLFSIVCIMSIVYSYFLLFHICIKLTYIKRLN